MTYALFLAIFLGVPIVLAGLATVRDHRRGIELPWALRSLPARLGVLLQVLIAVIYTTPWDNYLVATGVWYYHPHRVIGLTLGWVPIEEYTFFVLQTILSGLWFLILARRLPYAPTNLDSLALRRWSVLAIGVIWLASLILLALGWRPGTYLGLILIWALPPVMLQLAFGADILWHYRRLIWLALGSMTLYLGVTDSLAIRAGIWTIAPHQSLGLILGGSLPVEELLFFLVTNTLILFGLTLVLSQQGRARLTDWAEPWLSGRAWLERLKKSL